MWQKWTSFVGRLNSRGIPLPTVRDPKTGLGSISLTLVFVSSALMMLGIVGKYSGKLGGLDMSYAMQFFWTACALYWGRKFQMKDGASFGADSSSKDEPTVTTPTPAKSTPAPDNPDA